MAERYLLNLNYYGGGYDDENEFDGFGGGPSSTTPVLMTCERHYNDPISEIVIAMEDFLEENPDYEPTAGWPGTTRDWTVRDLLLRTPNSVLDDLGIEIEVFNIAFGLDADEVVIPARDGE